MSGPTQREGQGYIGDVAYPPHFQRETLPVWLASVLTALGRQSPDLRRPYTWLELGCGDGLGVLVAAATNPLGHFIGIDADAQAVARARTRAEAAGLTNARFHGLRFDAALAAQGLIPPCDFIVSHGVYSWIGPAQRQAMRRLAARHLKPGGVFYLAYISQPGAGAFAAAQRLMHLATRRLPGGSAEKVRAGHALLQRMDQTRAGGFADHPAARQELARMAAQVAQGDHAYLAHEYLNPWRDALHVADVMADFSDEADCDYAGSATPLENIDAVSLPAALQPLLAELQRDGADAAEAETFKDIARNQNLRRDIYQRRMADGGTLLLTPEAHRQALLAQRVALLPAAPAETTGPRDELVFDTRIGPVRLPGALAQPLLQALQAAPRSYAELARLPAYAPQPGFVSQLLQMLAWAGWLHVLRADGRAPHEADVAARLNAALSHGPTPREGPILALPAIGSAIPAPSDTSPITQARLARLG